MTSKLVSAFSVYASPKTMKVTRRATTSTSPVTTTKRKAKQEKTTVGRGPKAKRVDLRKSIQIENEAENITMSDDDAENSRLIDQSTVTATKKKVKRERTTAVKGPKKINARKSIKIKNVKVSDDVAESKMMGNDDAENEGVNNNDTLNGTMYNNNAENEIMNNSDAENQRMNNNVSENARMNADAAGINGDDPGNQYTDDNAESLWFDDDDELLDNISVKSTENTPLPLKRIVHSLSPVKRSKTHVIPKSVPCGTPAANEIFKWLLSPDNPEVFFKTKFEKEAYCVRRKNAGFYQGLFCTKDFDKIMKENRLLYDKEIDLVSYVNGEKITLQEQMIVHPDYVWSAFQDGNSVRMRNPQAYHKGLWQMCSLLQEYFSSPVGANMYLTPADSQGFAPHYDDIDAFILQIEGRKHWKVYYPRNNNETLPRYSSGDFTEDAIGRPCMEILLRAGDLLYIPRGFIHQAKATDKHSLHITISVNQLNTWGDFFQEGLSKALKHATENNVELRKSLPKDYLEHVGYAFVPSEGEVESPERRAFKKKASQLCQEVLRHFSVDEAADAHAEEFIHGCMPPVFNKQEGECSIHGNGSKFQDGIVKTVSSLTLESKIRLIRRRAFRLVVDERGALLFHTLNNSKNFKEEPSIYSEVEMDVVPAISALFQKYPEYIKIKDLPIIGGTEEKIGFAEGLYLNGYLITEKPLPANY